MKHEVTYVDVWRSILISQSAFVIIFLTFIYFMRLRSRPRPGYTIGVTAFSVGDLAAVVYVVVITLNRLGQPPDYVTVLATIAILGESFGCVLIALHLIFHDYVVMEKLKEWFHDHDHEKR